MTHTIVHTYYKLLVGAVKEMNQDPNESFISADADYYLRRYNEAVNYSLDADKVCLTFSDSSWRVKRQTNNHQNR